MTRIVVTMALILYALGPTASWAQVAPDSTTLVQTRDTIADLRSFVPSSPPYGLTVSIRGYTSVGDGGGGAFYWVPTSTASDDGGSVIKPTSVSGAGRWFRSFGSLAAPVHVKWFGADATGTNDSGAAISAAYAFLAAKGGTLYFDRGTYKIGTFPTIAANGTTIECEGDGNPFNGGGVVLEQSSTTGDFITFNSVSDSGIRNCGLAPTVIVSGYQINFISCFKCFAEHDQMQYAYNGISYTSPGGSLGSIRDISMRFMLGTKGLYFGGTTAPAVGGLTVGNMQADNPYPVAAASAAAVITWAPNKAVSLGQITHTNSAIYQVSTAGTTATSGSGPSGTPTGSSPSSAFSGTIADGTAQWRFEAREMYWVVNDSYGDTLRINNSAFLDAYTGVLYEDQVGGSVTYPVFSRLNDVEVERNYRFGMLINAGMDIQLINDYHNISLTAAGLTVGGNAKGLVTVTGGIFDANAAQGINITGGTGNRIVNAAVQNNSIIGAGSYPNINVAAGVSRIVLVGNTLDTAPNFVSQQVSYGIQVQSGASNYYYVVGNICGGTVTTCVFDQGTGTGKSVSANY